MGASRTQYFKLKRAYLKLYLHGRYLFFNSFVRTCAIVSTVTRTEADHCHWSERGAARLKMSDSAFAQSGDEIMPVDERTTDLNCRSYDDKENVKQPNDRELAVEIGEHYQVKRSDSTWRRCNPHVIAQTCCCCDNVSNTRQRFVT